MRLQKYLFTAALFFYVCIQVHAQENYTLQKALQTARANNPVLKTEQFNIGMAEADVVTAKLRPNPVLNNESLQIMDSEHFSESNDWHSKYNREVLWQIAKPIQWFGQRKNKINVAYGNLTLEEKNYTETERNLFLEVAQKWLEVWVAQKQIDIIQIAKENTDSLVKINQRRFNNQVITQTELFRTELLAKQYAIQYKTAAQEVKSRQKEFGFLLGVEEEVNVDSEDVFIFSTPHEIDSLLKNSLENRSDIQMAKSMVDVSNNNIKLQRSLAYPKPELGFIWNPQSAVPFMGISLSIDLPFFDRNQGEIKRSRYLKDQAEQQLFTIKNQIQSEIAVAQSDYQLQKQNIEEFKELLEQSETILENVKNAYLKGGTTIIDFLEAQRSWLDTQQQHFDALQSYRESYVQLLYATGLINQLAL